MAHKNPQDSLNTLQDKASNDALNELEQLRLIVFGQAKIDIEEKITALQQRLSTEMDMVQTQMNDRFAQLNEKLDQQHKATLATIGELENTQEANRTELAEANAKLASQLEMAENSSKDDSDHIHKRIDEEVGNLESSLDKTMNDVLAKLDQVSKELSNSKADRKTLAQLLTNVASDLSADD